MRGEYRSYIHQMVESIEKKEPQAIELIISGLCCCPLVVCEGHCVVNNAAFKTIIFAWAISPRQYDMIDLYTRGNSLVSVSYVKLKCFM